MSKKIKLLDLKVKSSVIELNQKERKATKGGFVFVFTGGKEMISVKKYFSTLTIALLLFSSPIPAFSWEIAKFPRLANIYHPSTIQEREIEILSGFDLLVLNYRLDKSEVQRERGAPEPGICREPAVHRMPEPLSAR